LELNKTHIGDCMELSKDIPDNYVDLVVTSPPYADTLSYGNDVDTYGTDEFSDWILPLFKESSRFLKSTGSFILNINDKIIKGERSIYVYDLVVRVVRETGLKLYDRYIWGKKSGLPTGGDKRLNDRIEYIFHFVKDIKNFKNYTDRIRIPYADSSIVRYKNKVNTNKVTDDGGIIRWDGQKTIEANPLGTIPPGLFDFRTNAAIRGAKHPAPFHPDLPEFFIRWLTDKGDVVLDPFMGGGTTFKVALNMNRDYIGFEINETYVEELLDPIMDNKNDFWE